MCIKGKKRQGEVTFYLKKSVTLWHWESSKYIIHENCMPEGRELSRRNKKRHRASLKFARSAYHTPKL